VALPSGTKIAMHYVYDNSVENPQNPNHPPKLVKGGNQATDEMAHLWLQVLPEARPGEAGDARVTLLESLAQHHVQSHPEDFSAHYNFAAMLQMRGDLAGAIAQYREALRLQPGDAVAENALGGALLASGDFRGAISHLRAATKVRPDYFDAHYNLG